MVHVIDVMINFDVRLLYCSIYNARHGLYGFCLDLMFALFDRLLIATVGRQIPFLKETLNINYKASQNLR